MAIEKMNTFNAWEIDAEAKRVLEAVGITDLNAKVDQVSAAGWCTANRKLPRDNPKHCVGSGLWCIDRWQSMALVSTFKMGVDQVGPCVSRGTAC